MRKIDFVSIRDFTPEEIRHFLHVACQVKARPELYANALHGKTLAMIFEKPSLRTRVTFDVGIEQHAVTVQRDGRHGQKVAQPLLKRRLPKNELSLLK